MVATFTKYLEENYGYSGLFLVVGSWGIVALFATLMYPDNPNPNVHGKPHILPRTSDEKQGEQTYQFRPIDELWSITWYRELMSLKQRNAGLILV